MSAARRNGSRSKAPVLVVLGLVLLIAITTLVGAATTERVVLDHRTGLAIYGFDPVAYFTDSQAITGDAELELSYAGAVWRFLNPGNRAAFAARPDIYMPQFGGYDPVVLAHAVATPGHPHLWLIADDRLFMFHSAEARDAFARDPRGAVERAAANWPKVSQTLVP